MWPVRAAFQPARFCAACVFPAAAYLRDRHFEQRDRRNQFSAAIAMLWSITCVRGWVVSCLPSQHQPEMDFIDAPIICIYLMRKVV